MNVLSLFAAIALLAGNAFFVGGEFSLISARRDRVESLVAAPRSRRHDRRAQIVLAALGHLSDMLAAAQLGITACSLGLGAVAEPAIAHLLESPLGAVGVPDAGRHAIAVAIALVIVVALHIVLGEMVPKNLALAGPERSALWLGPPLVAFARATRPLVFLLNAAANGLLRAVGVTPADELSTAYTPEELQDMIAESRREGLLPDTEHGLLTSALGLAVRDARSVMIPISEVVTVPWNVTPEMLEQLVRETGFSRFPVRSPVQPPPTGRGPRIAGFVHVKDVLGLPPEARTMPLPARRLRPMVALRADEPLDEVLRTMQRTGSQLAVVVGPGAETTLGVVALEDVVEELVGEVEDATHA